MEKNPGGDMQTGVVFMYIGFIEGLLNYQDHFEMYLTIYTMGNLCLLCTAHGAEILISSYISSALSTSFSI